jgi:hypothetical protein
MEEPIWTMGGRAVFERRGRPWMSQLGALGQYRRIARSVDSAAAILGSGASGADLERLARSLYKRELSDAGRKGGLARTRTVKA